MNFTTTKERICFTEIDCEIKAEKNAILTKCITHNERKKQN